MPRGLTRAAKARLADRYPGLSPADRRAEHNRNAFALAEITGQPPVDLIPLGTVARHARARSQTGRSRRPGTRRRCTSRASPGDDSGSSEPPGERPGRRLTAQPIGAAA
jgi:hypothetical protein